MVVAQIKRPLFRQRQADRIAFSQNILYLPDLPVKCDPKSSIQLAQMLLS